jgi:parallel beta-helix repeat protein
MEYDFMKRITIVWIWFIIIFSITVIYSSPVKIIYITIGGSGKYDCTGERDQEKINKVLEYIAKDNRYSTVYLKGLGSCIIDEPILMPSNTTLQGDSTAVLKLKDNLNWSKYKPMIGQTKVNSWTAYGNENERVSNIEIGGFKIDAGLQKRLSGTTYFPLILFYNPYNISIHDLTLTRSRWDAIRLTSFPIKKSINSKIYNNKILDSGHEGICLVNTTDFEIYDNNISRTRTNCGIRVKSGDKFSIHDNIIGNSLGKESSGYAGILLENSNPNSGIEKATIFNNLIYGKNSGIVLDGGVRTFQNRRENVHIHDNIIYRTKTATIPYLDGSLDLDGAIRISDFNNTLIENNIIEGNVHDAIIYESQRDNNDSYQTMVRDNIIINNGRYGINNSKKFEQNHTFILKNNLLYNNKNNYFNILSSSDFYKKPLFIKPHTIKENWHHIVVSYDNNMETIILYIDGQKRIERRCIGFGDINPNDESLFIGGYRGIAHWFNGKISLTIWNRVLNFKEIEILYGNSIKKDIHGGLVDKIELNLTTTIFNKGKRYSIYPSNLSFNPNFTISTWIYTVNQKSNYQTIFNKGNEGSKNYIWIYIKKDNVFVDLVNRGKHLDVDTSILNLQDIFYLKK